MLGRPLLARTLDALVAAGCEAVAINLHYLPEAIPAAFGERHAGVPLVYSREDPILGTSGAFLPLRELFAACDTVLLVNGDSLCDWPLSALLDRHRRRRAVATLLLAGRPDPRPFGSWIEVDGRGRVTAITGEPCAVEVARGFVYAGAYALAPTTFERLPAGFSDSMRDLFPALLAEGARVESFVTWRPWHDLGTPARYLDALLDRAARAGVAEWRHERSSVARAAALSRVVVEEGAVIEDGARVERSVVLPGARVGAGARLRRVLVGPGVVLPAGSVFEDALLSGSRRGADLSVTPLG